jgi:hypothetical protein
MPISLNKPLLVLNTDTLYGYRFHDVYFFDVVMCIETKQYIVSLLSLFLKQEVLLRTNCLLFFDTIRTT